MVLRTLIKNGTIVTAVDQYKGDLLLEGEKIALIGTSAISASAIARCVASASARAGRVSA